MNKQKLTETWDQFRQKYGVYSRLVEAFPEDQYHTHPVRGLRSFAEQVTHTSGTIVRDIAVGVSKGEITATESEEVKAAKELTTRAAMQAYVKRCWDEANAAVASIDDAKLNAMVSTPWDMRFPGYVGFDIMNDEFLHHRGQLAVYTRIVGAKPPFIWGFQENAPEYRPAH
jgi:uncharacterized damage-inducible protein DinB